MSEDRTDPAPGDGHSSPHVGANAVEPAHRDPRALLAMGLQGLAKSPSGGSRWEPPALEDVQRELPQYTILALLGRGGMGAVYKARQDSLDRMVALKILPPALDDGDLAHVERFRQEARALAMFKHPGIVGVYDAGESPGGMRYFAMEFIEGRDVGRMLAEMGKLAPTEATRIARAVCAALAYAHDRGVLHRDIKPSNVLLEADGSVKVADFGLAKLISGDGEGFTRTDMALGSPDFTAPECSLPGSRIDGRADIYSVGVMLYQMLTGTIPRGRFEPPSRLVPALGRRFDAVIDKALQSNRNNRHRTVAELAAELERLELPASAGPRHRARQALIVAVLALCPVAWLVLQASRPPPSPSTGIPAQPAATPAWQRVEFARLDPVTALLNVPDRKMDGAFLRLRDYGRWTVPVAAITPLKQHVHRNLAVRTTVMVQSAAHPSITLRYTPENERQYACLLYRESLCLQRQSGKGQPLKVDYFPLPHVPLDGEEHTLQFACVGNRQIVWFDSRLLGRLTDNSIDEAGRFGIQAKDALFKSLEYLPLDGMTEEQALQLLGAAVEGPHLKTKPSAP